MLFVPRSPMEPFGMQVRLRNVSACRLFQMCQGVVYKTDLLCDVLGNVVDLC